MNYGLKASAHYWDQTWIEYWDLTNLEQVIVISPTLSDLI